MTGRIGVPPVAAVGWACLGHAGADAIGVTVLLGAATAPVLDLRLGWPDDGNLPQARTERQADDLIADGFGHGVNGPLLIAVDVSEDADVVKPLHAAVSTDPGVAAVMPAMVDAEAGVATILAVPPSHGVSGDRSPADCRSLPLVAGRCR